MEDEIRMELPEARTCEPNIYLFEYINRILTPDHKYRKTASYLRRRILYTLRNFYNRDTAICNFLYAEPYSTISPNRLDDLKEKKHGTQRSFTNHKTNTKLNVLEEQHCEQ